MCFIIVRLFFLPAYKLHKVFFLAVFMFLNSQFSFCRFCSFFVSINNDFLVICYLCWLIVVNSFLTILRVFLFPQLLIVYFFVLPICNYSSYWLFFLQIVFVFCLCCCCIVSFGLQESKQGRFGRSVLKAVPIIYTNSFGRFRARLKS